jgi:hypothetical protein
MPAFHQRPSAPTNLTLHEALDEMLVSEADILDGLARSVA